jgi:O-antigen/teichoic acid export membrane protein
VSGSGDTTEPVSGSTEHLDEAVAGAVRGLFGRDAVYTILWAVQLVVAAGVTPLLTRALSAPSFGTVAAATTVMQVLFVLAGFGLYPAIQRQYAAHAPSRDPAKILTFSILIAALMTGVADITGPLWSDLIHFSSYDGPVRIAVFWAGASAVTNSALSLLRSQDRLLAFSTVSLLQSVVAAVTSLLLVTTVADTAGVFLLGQLGVQAAAAAIALILTRPRLFGRGDRAMIQRALVFGVPLIPAVLSTFVLHSSDRLIIQSELGAVAVARYQIAYNYGSLPILMLSVLYTSWMPRIFSLKEGPERAVVIGASRNFLYMLLMPALIGLAVGAPIFLRLWAPPRYMPEQLLLVNAFVLISAIPYTAGLSATRALMAEGRTGFIAMAQGTAAFANVALNFLLIPTYQLVGSAASTFLAFTLLHVLLLVRARTLVPVRPPGVRLRLGLVATAAVAVVTTALPPSDYLLIRFAVILLTLAWFAAIFNKTRTGDERSSTNARQAAP